MNARQQIEALQREIQKLGGEVPEAVQRQLQALQNELQNVRVRPLVRLPRIPIVNPTPPGIPLNPDELIVWNTFMDYLASLCQLAGETNRDQWLHLVDVAADMTASLFSNAISEAPTGPQQPWARDGATRSWILTTGSPPSTGGPYGWDSTTDSWVPVEIIPVLGVTDGSQSPPGIVGELLTLAGITTVTASPVPPYQVAGTLMLPAGDWDVYANFYALLTIAPGNVVNGTVWWGFLGPSSIPLGNTDSQRPADNVAWIGGDEVSLIHAEGGSIGPIRMLQSAPAGVDIRIIVGGASGTAQINWAISARRMR